MPKIPIRRPGNEPGDQKMKELILYISWKELNDAKFGAIKLNKLLFFSDFLAHAHFGHSISGQEYQKLEHGPAPRQLMPIRTSMQEKGDLAIQVTDFWGHTQQRTIPLRNADMTVFESQEIALIDSVLDQLKDSSGKDVSDLSHQFGGWQIVEIGETIPYATALIKELTTCPPTPYEQANVEMLEQMAFACLSRTH